MTTARLNEDVLAIVCEFLTDVPDVLSFALTCSALRPAATTRLLSMRSIRLTVGVSVRQFHAFLFADAPARAPHIRALSIDLESKERHGRTERTIDTPLLIDILAACPHLEQVSLSFTHHYLGVPEELPIMDALAALPTLRSLSLYGPSEDALTLVGNFPTPLRALTLSQCGPGEVAFWHPAALEQFLSHLAPTLEKLKIYQFVVDPDMIQALGLISEPPDSGSGSGAQFQFQFRAVRSLFVALLVGTPLLGALQHLFPALDGTLSLGQFMFQDEAEFDDEDEEQERAAADVQQAYATVRAANQRAQDVAAWTKLDRVICDSLFFYVLGLRCPVRLAMLDFTPAHPVAFSQAARRAMEALRANPVPRLKLSLVLNDGLGVFDALFSPELGARLTHLTLCLLYASDSMWSDTLGGSRSQSRSGSEDAVPPPPLRWDDLLDAICASLRPLRELAYLRIVIHSNAFDDGYAPGSPPAAHAHAHSRELVHALCGCDANQAQVCEAAAAALARPLPSLRYVFLTTSVYLPTHHNDDKEGTVGPGSGSGAEDAKARTCGVRERREVGRAWRVAERSAGTGAGTGAMRGSEGGPVPGQVKLVELHDDVAETIIRTEELVVSELDTAWMHTGDDRP